jgi:hypothetical protein
MQQQNSTTAQDLASKLNGVPPRSCKPAVGDIVAGEIVDLDVGESDLNQEPFPILTLRQDDGEEIRVFGWHWVLKDKIAKLAPKMGESIAIRYDGTPEGKKYQSYRVRMNRAIGIDYETMVDESESEKELVHSGNDAFGDDGF